MKLNDDAQNFITGVAKKIVRDQSKLKPKLNPIGNNTYKLDLTEEGKRDYNNMFGRFIHVDDEPMPTEYLEEIIVASLNEYMKVIDDNIVMLEQGIIWGGPDDTLVDATEPPEGLILKSLTP